MKAKNTMTVEEARTAASSNATTDCIDFLSNLLAEGKAKMEARNIPWTPEYTERFVGVAKKYASEYRADEQVVLAAVKALMA